MCPHPATAAHAPMVHGPATIARVGAILATNPRLIAAPSSPNLAMKELTWIRTDGHDRAERQPQQGGDPQDKAAARCAERAPGRAHRARSEERRGGTGWDRGGRYRWAAV